MSVPKTYLVEVAPITKSPLVKNLYYFATSKIPPGTLVKIQLRKSSGLGLVLSAKDVQSAKTEIRKAGFTLKKIKKSDILEAKLSPALVQALEEVSNYYALSQNHLLATLLPKIVSDKIEQFIISNPRSTERRSEISLYQMEASERFSQYRMVVRQNFARKKSVMLVVPNHLEATEIKEELSKGISEFVFTFSLSDKPSVARENWLKALGEKHPVLFITTPAGLLFHRDDLETVILERENSRAYKTIVRPFIDYRFLVERMAKHLGRDLIMGDSVLSLQSLWREKSGQCGESSLVRWRLPASQTKFVDINTKQNDGGTFEIISPELKELISNALNEKEPSMRKVFLFGARKGLAPTTVCGDCGALLACKNCGAPMVLHKRGETSFYLCHSCTEERPSATLCDQCQSWKLVPLGIGTEEIARQVQNLFPQVEVAVLDKEHAVTDAKAKAIAHKFETDGGILVGTELAFFHVKQVPYSGLVSVDSLFSIPDFYINERVFYLVSRLRELTTKESLIQTRRGIAGAQTLFLASQGNILDFYQSEIAEREALLYPPFSIFIKIESTTKDPLRLMNLRERLNHWQPDIIKHSLVIRLERARWPDPLLLAELSLLERDFSIKVEPESIL